MVRGSSSSSSCYWGPGSVRLLLQCPSTQFEFKVVAQKCRWEDMAMHFQGTNYLFVFNTQIIEYSKFYWMAVKQPLLTFLLLIKSQFCFCSMTYIEKERRTDSFHFHGNARPEVILLHSDCIVIVLVCRSV